MKTAKPTIPEELVSTGLDWQLTKGFGSSTVKVYECRFKRDVTLTASYYFDMTTGEPTEQNYYSETVFPRYQRREFKSLEAMLKWWRD